MPRITKNQQIDMLEYEVISLRDNLAKVLTGLDEMLSMIPYVTDNPGHTVQSKMKALKNEIRLMAKRTARSDMAAEMQCRMNRDLYDLLETSITGSRPNDQVPSKIGQLI